MVQLSGKPFFLLNGVNRKRSFPSNCDITLYAFLYLSAGTKSAGGRNGLTILRNSRNRCWNCIIQYAPNGQNIQFTKKLDNFTEIRPRSSGCTTSLLTHISHDDYIRPYKKKTKSQSRYVVVDELFGQNEISRFAWQRKFTLKPVASNTSLTKSTKKQLATQETLLLSLLSLLHLIYSRPNILSYSTPKT